jgi:hypothetical protein
MFNVNGERHSGTTFLSTILLMNYFPVHQCYHYDSNKKNKSYNLNIDDYRDIININKNVGIENYINNLTFEHF